MKTIQLHLEDEEYKRILESKQNKTWREFLLSKVNNINKLE